MKTKRKNTPITWPAVLAVAWKLLKAGYRLWRLLDGDGGG
jgi:hypothetical protein